MQQHAMNGARLLEAVVAGLCGRGQHGVNGVLGTEAV